MSTMERKRFYENIILPAFLALLVFLFLPGSSYYLFAEDSLTFFGRFTFYQNPLFSFNFGIEMFYFSAIDKFIVGTSSNVAIGQHFLIFIATYIATVGFFDLVDVVRVLPQRFCRITSKIIGSIIFLYNPFTLSVIWSHFEGWSILMILSPFIISFLTSTLYNGGNFKRFALTSLLTIVLVGGILGPFYPFFLIIIGIFLLFIIYHFVTGNRDRPSLLLNIKASVYVISYVAVSTLWAILPAYLVSARSLVTGFKSAFLISFLESESTSTTLSHVLSLTGYSWIYDVPSAYPWIGFLHILQIAGYAMLFVALFSLIILRKYKKLLPIAFVAALAAIFSIGSNFPFSFINEHLLLLKGPFLFLVNPYYFTIQFYVLFVALLLSFVFYEALTIVSKGLYPERIFKKQSFRNARHRYFSIIVIAILLIIISVFFYPFATEQVYQQQGVNIDAIDINNGLMCLRNFLEKNYTSPDYYSLLIPTSSLYGATFLTYNDNASFADSIGLISSVDPFPLIWQDNNYISTVTENYLSSNNLQNIEEVMSFLHIKFIIFTRNYDANNAFMLESPDLNHYNFTSIYDHLIEAFGSPLRFGSYYVFTNPYADPTVEMMEHPVFVNSTLSDYVTFLASINLSKISGREGLILYNAIISNRTSDNQNLLVVSYNVDKSYTLPVNGSYLLMDNGTMLSPLNIGLRSDDGHFQIEPDMVASLTNTSSFSTDMIMKNGTLSSDNGSSLWVNRTTETPSSLTMKFEFANMTHNYRNYFNFNFGNITVSAQFINVSNGPGNMDLQLTANFTNDTNPYAWNDIGIPLAAMGKNVSLTFQVYPDHSLNISATVRSIGFSTFATFYYGSNNYKRGAYNASRFESSKSISSGYRFYFNSGGFPTFIYNLSIMEQLPVGYIITENVSRAPVIENISIGTNMFGDYELRVDNPVNSSYVFFFEPPSGEWNLYYGSSNTSSVISENNVSAVFLLSHITSGSSISIKYESIIPEMFYLSVTEVIALLLGLILTSIYGLYRKKLDNKRST